MRKLNHRRWKDINVSAILAIGRNCPLLTELDLLFTQVDDACLVAIADRCHCLTSLRFNNGLNRNSHATFLALAEACPLEILEILGCMDQSIKDEMQRHHIRIFCPL